MKSLLHSKKEEKKDMQPKTNIKVKFVGEDGNAFAILGKVRKALQEHGYSKEEVDQYTKEAIQGDYNNLLQVTMQWVEVE